MSSIRHALERLDTAIEKLDFSVADSVLKKSQQASSPSARIDSRQIATRLDMMIKKVENLLREDGV